MSNKKTALSETEGVSSPEMTNAAAVLKLKAKRRLQRTTKDLVSAILNGNITALSQAITLVESKNLQREAEIVVAESLSKVSALQMENESLEEKIEKLECFRTPDEEWMEKFTKTREVGKKYRHGLVRIQERYKECKNSTDSADEKYATLFALLEALNSELS